MTMADKTEIFYKKISTQDDLPTEEGEYFVFKHHDYRESFDTEEFDGKMFCSDFVTHWLKQVSI